jgi:hypothetical protein
VSGLRAKLGLTAGSRNAESDGAPESLRATGRGPKRQQQGRPARVSVVEPTTELLSRSLGKGQALDDLELDLDRLIFKLVALGGLETIEDELRKVRRLLYRAAYAG